MVNIRQQIELYTFNLWGLDLFINK